MIENIRRNHWRRGLACVSCCILLLTAGCSDRRSEQLRDRGDTLLKTGRPIAEAREAYQQSEEANPENPLAQLGLARCAAAEGNIDEALIYHARALVLAPELEESHMESVRLLMDANRLEEALAAADRFAGIVPEKGGLLYAAVLVAADRAGEAVSYLEDMQGKYPDSSEVKLNLAIAYADSGQPGKAEELLVPLAADGSTIAHAAELALITVYQAQGKIDELIAYFEGVADARPDDLNAQLGYARSLLLANRPDEAEQIARKVLESDPASGWANYIVGSLKLRGEAFDEAVAFLESAAAALPEEEEVTVLLDAARSGKLPEKAPSPQGTTATASKAPAGAPTWRDLWQQAALGRLIDSRDATLAQGGVEAREVLVLAALFTRNIPIARELAAELPADSKVGGFLAALESQDSKQVADFFAEWNPEEPDKLLQRDNALGYAMASGGARGQALSVFLFSLERWPDNMVALFNIAQVFRAVQQPIIAAQQLQRLIVKYPENIDAHQMLYSALREGAAFDQARKAAEASYTLFPEERWSFMFLSQSYLDTGDPELALQVLHRASSLYSDDPEIELALAGVLVRLGDCEQARQKLEAIVTSAPTVSGGRATLYALCDIQADDWSQIGTYVQSVDDAGLSENLRLIASVAYLKAGDPDAARDVLQPVGAQGPIGGTLNRMLLAAAGGSAEGLTEEEQAWVARLSSDQELLVHYFATHALRMAGFYDAAWSYYKAHLDDQVPHIALVQLGYAALDRSERVEEVAATGLEIANKLPDDPRSWLGLAQVLEKIGDEAGQGSALERALEVGQDNPEVWFRNATFQEKQGNPAGSAESYRKLLAIQPDNAAASNNLAYMLLQQGGHDEEALEMASFAKEKLPTNPGVLHTLGRAQMRIGDFEASRTTLAQATEIDPANPTIMFDYARVLLELGEKEEARNRVRYAVAMSKRAGIDFPELADAESMLADLEI